MPFAAGLALALSAVLNGSTAVAATGITLMPTAQTVQEYVDTYFADIPILVKIAECESHFKQYDNAGSAHRGVVNNQDVGVMQINEHYHLDSAKKLGFDIYTLQGNVAYARYLYESQGTQPWSSSKPCWGQSNKVADKVAVK